MLDGFSIIQKALPGYIVTFVQGVTKQELLRRFGGDSTHTWLIPCGDLNALEEHEGYREYLDDLFWRNDKRFQGNYAVWNRPWIQVGECGDWAFALEREITSEGIRPECLCKVSIETRAVSISRNGGNGSACFSYAVNGVLLAQFDPVDPDDLWVGDPTLVQKLFRQATVHPESDGYDDMEALFSLAEGIGVCFNREALMGQMLTGEIFPLP